MHLYINCMGDIIGTRSVIGKNSNKCNCCGGEFEYLGLADTKDDAMLLFDKENWNLNAVEYDLDLIFRGGK